MPSPQPQPNTSVIATPPAQQPQDDRAALQKQLEALQKQSRMSDDQYAAEQQKWSAFGANAGSQEYINERRVRGNIADINARLSHLDAQKTGEQNFSDEVKQANDEALHPSVKPLTTFEKVMNKIGLPPPPKPEDVITPQDVKDLTGTPPSASKTPKIKTLSPKLMKSVTTQKGPTQ